MYQCKTWVRYISETAHMCGCDTEKTPTRARGRSSPWGQDHYGEEILPIGSTTEERGRVTLLPVTLLFTQSSWRSGPWFPLNEPPAGCLNRPLINPSVGSLLRPQPSEERSNPAMQTERRPSAQRGGQNRVREGFFFFHCPFTESSNKGRISPHESYKWKCLCHYCANLSFNWGYTIDIKFFILEYQIFPPISAVSLIIIMDKYGYVEQHQHVLFLFLCDRDVIFLTSQKKQREM